MPRRPVGWAALILPVVALLGLILLVVATAAFSPYHSDSKDSPEKKQVVVWAIMPTKVYHCPGSRWYGKTKDGKYLNECEAVREGFRPAFGQGCGSECKE